jgi:hypothetical protein
MCRDYISSSHWRLHGVTGQLHFTLLSLETCHWVQGTMKRDTTHLHYKDQLINAVKEIVAVYSENHTKPMKPSVGKMQRHSLLVKACGTYSYHKALKG